MYLTTQQRAAADEVDTLIDELPPFERLRCRTPEYKNGVAYYPHMDYDERLPPTAEEADLMCRTSGIKCPIAEQCLALGLALQATTGVWGGKVLLDGETYH